MAAMIGEGDRADWHIEDTLKAGDYYNKKKGRFFLVENSKEALNWLQKREFYLTKSLRLKPVIVLRGFFHTTDFTGQDIEKTLLKKISENKKIKVFKNSLAIDLIVKNNICQGVFVLTEDNKIVPFFAKGNNFGNWRGRSGLSMDDQSGGCHRRWAGDGNSCRGKSR